MDLVIAAIELAAVIDIRGIAVEGRAERSGHRAWGDDAVFQASVGRGASDRHAHRVGRGRGASRARSELEDADTITIRRQSLVTLGTGAAGFAMVFDVHAEGDGQRSAAAIGHGVITDTREADLVRGSAARLRTAIPVARIAETADNRAGTGVGIARASEASAFQAVKMTSMEVAVQAGPEVADMFPFTFDTGRARIPLGRGAHRRADLAAMGDILSNQRIGARIHVRDLAIALADLVLLATTGYAASGNGHWLGAAQRHGAGGGVHRSGEMNGVAQGRRAVERHVSRIEGDDRGLADTERNGGARSATDCQTGFADRNRNGRFAQVVNVDLPDNAMNAVGELARRIGCGGTAIDARELIAFDNQRHNNSIVRIPSGDRIKSLAGRDDDTKAARGHDVLDAGAMLDGADNAGGRITGRASGSKARREPAGGEAQVVVRYAEIVQTDAGLAGIPHRDAIAEARAIGAFGSGRGLLAVEGAGVTARCAAGGADDFLGHDDVRNARNSSQGRRAGSNAANRIRHIRDVGVSAASWGNRVDAVDVPRKSGTVLGPANRNRARVAGDGDTELLACAGTEGGTRRSNDAARLAEGDNEGARTGRWAAIASNAVAQREGAAGARSGGASGNADGGTSSRAIDRAIAADGPGVGDRAARRADRRGVGMRAAGANLRRAREEAARSRVDRQVGLATGHAAK